MQFVDEYRSREKIFQLSEAIKSSITQDWSIMEVCGGQTHALMRFGLDRLLPECLHLLHGPGCPVCVTPLEKINQAHRIAKLKNVIFCSFGDMLRVPGSHGDLLAARAEGAQIRIVYSPLDAVNLAMKYPDKEVVFFAIGFETTAPANAMAVEVARRKQLRNFSLLVSHMLTPPVITAILQSPGNKVQGFLAPGHVCTVTGLTEYEAISRRFRIPMIVTGFEPLDLLEGLYHLVKQLESGKYEVENQYARSASREGNPRSLSLLEKVFTVCDQQWRGIGNIPKSGFKLAYEYRPFDAEYRFPDTVATCNEPATCISGLILKGQKKPFECPAFGIACKPEHPLGATMVSAEGACAAYYAYRREHGTETEWETRP